MTLELDCRVGGARRVLDLEIEQRNPADLGEVVSRLPDAGADVVGEAAAAARGALARLDAGVEARADALERIGAALFAQRNDLGELIARETGKTVTDAEAEVARAARLFRFFGGEALRIVGERFASTRPGVSVEVSYDPVGVVGAITPWNFPVAIPAWKIAPAIAFGNAVVWKPSEHASASAAALFDLVAESGLPAGALNLVLGGRRTGEALVEDRGIDAVSFTGSEGVGRAVVRGAASRGARVQAEMGGVNGLVVLADADLDAAVEGAINGAFFAAGQRCTATSRIIVEQSIFETFTARLLERMANLRVGDPRDRATQIGPLVSPHQKATVLSTMEALAKSGRRPLGGGRGADAPACFIDPMVYAELATGDLVLSEEIFGPVAGLVPVEGYEAALDVLNATRFGLCAGIYTRSLARAEDFKRNARAGMTMVNLPTAGVDYHAPFGGLKASSFGPREQGRAARDFYTVTRTAYQAAGAA